jgi:hypothetical protein
LIYFTGFQAEQNVLSGNKVRVHCFLIFFLWPPPTLVVEILVEDTCFGMRLSFYSRTIIIFYRDLTAFGLSNIQEAMHLVIKYTGTAIFPLVNPSRQVDSFRHRSVSSCIKTCCIKFFYSCKAIRASFSVIGWFVILIAACPPGGATTAKLSVLCLTDIGSRQRVYAGCNFRWLQTDRQATGVFLL